MPERFEPKPSRHITEFSDIPKKIETVFDPKNPPHLKDKFIKQYLEQRDMLQEEQIKDIETHINIPCEKCAARLQNKRRLF